MDYIRHPRKSMLGNHGSQFRNTTLNDTSHRKFEILPRSLQIAETLRKQRSASNNENAFVSNMKNLSIRQPRKSMLGTRKLNRDSIVPPPPENDDTNEVESNSSANDSLTSGELKTSTSVPTISSIDFLRRDSVLRELPKDVFREHLEPAVSVDSATSPLILRNVPISEGEFPKNVFCKHPETTVSRESIASPSMLRNLPICERELPEDEFRKQPEPVVSRESPASTLILRNVPIREIDSKDNSFLENETIFANEESVLATTIIDTSVANENSFLATTLKDITNTSADCTKDEATLLKDSVIESNESNKEDDMLFKMLDLMNTWMRRNTESIEIYEKEIAELQQKVAQANEEIESMKNLKRTLIKQFSMNKRDKENIFEGEHLSKPMATIMEDQVSESPTKTCIDEMRSTIKFMKTPITSRSRPRTSMLLTPHSMSFCLMSQYEQLIG